MREPDPRTFDRGRKPISKKRTIHKGVGKEAGRLDSPDKLLSWRVDWAEYFRRFSDLHGGNPVELGGVLVFEDGWQYSATDPSGPEYPPPTKLEELLKLRLAYLRERAGIVRDEVKALREARARLAELLLAKNAPLPRRVFLGKDDKGLATWEHQDLSLIAIDARLEWLDADLAETERRREGLIADYKKAKQARVAV